MNDSPRDRQVRSPDLRPPPRHGSYNRTTRRYAIWTRQIADGHEPCFGTAVRLTCQEYGCPYRTECLSLRVPWRR